MKLSKSIIAFLTISSDAQFGSVEQKRSKKRGALKRFGWKWPLCRDAENFCDCGGEIGSGSVKSGVISVGEVDEKNQNITSVPYGTKQKCMWHITVPKKHSIHMEFDRDYGFEVEYHNFCGFDKIHLLKGHYGPNQEGIEKIARFCGPRENGQPWDGARKVYAPVGMPFWDVPYNSESNKVTVAWDSDQSKNGMKGFKLRWWAVPDAARTADPFETLTETMQIMRDRILPLIQIQTTVPIKVRYRQTKQLNNVLTKLEKAVEEKGPNGEKSCSDMEVFMAPNDQLRSVCDINVHLIIVLTSIGISWSEHF